MTLRVNLKRTSREAYIRKLEAEQRAAVCCEHSPVGVRLAEPATVTSLPGFSEGDVSVQDEAAQLVGEVLDIEASYHVLDACAAPGGKTGLIAERLDENGSIVALDVNADRIGLIQDNLKRLCLDETAIVGDARESQEWWDGNFFDRILVDAPCSGSGVIRRHPDIKVLRQASDIPNFVKTQNDILNSVWPTLKPNGILVYATCSIFVEENDHVVESFLGSHPDAIVEVIRSQWGQDTKHGKQVLPGEQEMDGFYYAKIRKTAD